MTAMRNIEALRLEAGLSKARLCQCAGVSAMTYWRGLKGAAEMTPLMLARLETAVNHQRGHDGRPPIEILAETAWRGYVVALAGPMGVDAAEVLNAVPARRATNDPIWLRSEKVRSAALYCVNVSLNVPGATLARAVGLTRQAVSLALRRVEGLRDDRDFDKLLAAIEPLIAPRGGVGV